MIFFFTLKFFRISFLSYNTNDKPKINLNVGNINKRSVPCGLLLKGKEAVPMLDIIDIIIYVVIVIETNNSYNFLPSFKIFCKIVVTNNSV